MFDMYDLYDIDYYYYSCSIYVATLYVDCGPVYCMTPACLPCVCLQNCDKQNDSEISDCARGLNSTGRRGILGAYGLKSTGRCESSARAHFANIVRTLLKLVLFSSVVLVLRHFVELIPQVYRGTGTLLFNVGHLL